MASVILVNHRTENCGVMQFGRRFFSHALRSKKHECNYIEVNERWEFEHWVEQLHPQIVFYNFYTAATMPWVSPEYIRGNKGRFKQICLFHEVPLDSLGFDLLVHQEPTNEVPGFINISRPIPEYIPYLPVPEIPTFGSFGFGLGGKGFDKLVDKVSSEYEEAIIRINIPYAAFGDADGRGARDWAAACRQRIRMPRIQLDITHDFLSEVRLLDFLSTNTINCFFYDENYGRGISGTTDYCLGAGRPIAVTRSYQFQHLWKIEPRVLIDGRSLHEMINQGVDHLQVFHELWGGTKVTEDFDHIFDLALGDS